MIITQEFGSPVESPALGGLPVDLSSEAVSLGGNPKGKFSPFFLRGVELRKDCSGCDAENLYTLVCFTS